MQQTKSEAPPAAEGLLRPTQRHPWLTWSACAACVLVFIGIHTEPHGNPEEAISRWGWRPPADIYSGAYWTLITSVFVHIELWHLVFNLYWLYHLGRRLEQAIGSWRWLGFFLGAAVVSSGAEQAVSDNTGIGASGVGYALFGFMWITRKRVPIFAEILDQRTVLMFLGWLVGCLVLTIAKVWAVGNAAHFTGLLYGTALAAWLLDKPRRRLISTAIAVLALATVLPLFWAPWSMSWTSWRGVRAHKKDDLAAAIEWYERSLRLGQDRIWCLENIALARGSMGDERAYQKALQALRELDAGAAQDVEGKFKQPGH